MIDELQRLIDTNPEQKSRISPWITNIYRNLAFEAEILRQFGLFQLSASMMEAEGPSQKGDEEVAKLIKPLKPFDAAMQKLSIGEADFLDGGRFDYPAYQRRNANLSNQMIAAESKLDIFWAKCNAGIAGQVCSMQKMLQGFINLEPTQRTLPWIKPLPVEPKRQAGANGLDGVPATTALFELETRTETILGTDE